MSNRIINMALTLFLMFFLLLPIQLYSQAFSVKGDIKYGTSAGELSNEVNFKSGLYYDIIPDDLEIDYENNIYLCDRFTKNIFKFTSNMELLYEKRIDDKYFKQILNSDNIDQSVEKVLYQIDLETDNLGNLYLLISITDLYVNMIKYDKNGNLVDNFYLTNPFPKQYLRNFFISSNNRIYIKTFPFSPQDITYTEDGIVFVYDLDGEFLGRVDYYIEDNKGNIYKRNLLSNDYLQIDSYYPTTPNNVKKTSERKIKSSLKIDYSNQKTWYFLGVDNSDNIYFIHGKQTMVIRKFNFSDNSIEDLKIEGNEMKEFGVLFVNNHNNISIGPSGDIFYKNPGYPLGGFPFIS